jgi:hypothetical protein
MVCLQDDKEIVQAVEQELQQRRTALQALEPNADVDGDQGMNEDSPALMVGLLPACVVQTSQSLPRTMHSRPTVPSCGVAPCTHHY